MNHVYVLGILFLTLAFCAGCTSSQYAPPQSAPVTPAPAPLPVTATIATPIPTATPWPGALSLNQLATFGTANRTGTATVYKAVIWPDYNWTSPSLNSPHSQMQAGTPLGIQNGFNTQEPSAGNAFLIVYVRITDTGTMDVVAPSPVQFTVNYDGKDYSYSSVAGSDVTVRNIFVPQYDYLIGKGGEAGYIRPGDSNSADGFLIFEVPATIDLSKAALVITADAANRAAWKLA